MAGPSSMRPGVILQPDQAASACVGISAAESQAHEEGDNDMSMSIDGSAFLARIVHSSPTKSTHQNRQQPDAHVHSGAWTSTAPTGSIREVSRPLEDESGHSLVDTQYTAIPWTIPTLSSGIDNSEGGSSKSTALVENEDGRKDLEGTAESVAAPEVSAAGRRASPTVEEVSAAWLGGTAAALDESWEQSVGSNAIAASSPADDSTTLLAPTTSSAALPLSPGPSAPLDLGQSQFFSPGPSKSIVVSGAPLVGPDLDALSNNENNTSTPARTAFVAPQPLTLTRDSSSMSDGIDLQSRLVLAEASPKPKAFYQSAADAAGMLIAPVPKRKRTSDFSQDMDESEEESERGDRLAPRAQLAQRAAVEVDEVDQLEGGDDPMNGENVGPEQDPGWVSFAKVSVASPVTQGREVAAEAAEQVPASIRSPNIDMQDDSTIAAAVLPESEDLQSLSAIAELVSSFDPQCSQLELEPTQLDSLRNLEPLSPEEIVEGRRVLSFTHESNPISRAGVPPPGRELRRVAPPLTPQLEDAPSTLSPITGNDDSSRLPVNVPLASSPALKAPSTASALVSTPLRYPANRLLDAVTTIPDSTKPQLPQAKRVGPQAVSSKAAVQAATGSSTVQQQSTFIKPAALPAPASKRSVNLPPKSAKDKKRGKSVSNIKGKGKGRAASPPASPDALDLLGPDIVNETFDPDTLMHETNYDEAPQPHNATKTKLKGAGPDQSIISSGYGTRGTGSKRKAIEGTLIRTGKRLKSSALASKPGKRDKVAKPVAPQKSRKGSVPFLSEKFESARKVEVGKAITVASPSTSSRVGSSRGRAKLYAEADTDDEYDNLDDIEDPDMTMRQQQAAAVAREAGKAASGAGSRDIPTPLPASAPFTRVFGFWRDDKGYYPGRMAGLVMGGVRVIFDDGAEDILQFDKIRKCELVQGDYVRFGGDDTNAGAAREEVRLGLLLKTSVRVHKVERAAGGDNGIGLAPSDVVVVSGGSVSLEEQESAPQANFKCSSIFIEHKYTSQFDDRRLTLADIAALSPPRGHLLSVPTSTTSSNLQVTSRPGTFFDKIACLVTVADVIGSKDTVLKRLQAHGGTGITPYDIFEIDATENAARPLELKFALERFTQVNAIILLSDRSSTTQKYLVALALGIPCVSTQFVDDCIAQNQRLDWRNYIIAAGLLKSGDTQAYFMGAAQVESLSRGRFGLDAIAECHKTKALFRGKSFLKLVKKGVSSLTSADALRCVLVAAGAERVDFIDHIDNAHDGAGYSYVLVDKDTFDKHALPKGLKAHQGLCDTEWMKQCLIAGRILASSRS